MLNSTDKIIKHKIGRSNLAKDLGNACKACQIVGLSCDALHRSQVAGGVAALFERSRRKPNSAHRADQASEDAVIKSATDVPAVGQARMSKKLRKPGVFVSPSGVRSIWRQHDLANFKTGLKALHAKGL